MHIFTDGGARGNPGPAASAFVVYSPSKQVIYQSGHYLGVTTNNMAEYQGVLDALIWLVANYSACELNFFLDSTLVANQLSGRFRVKEARFLPLIQQIFDLVKQGHFSVTYTTIPRIQNQAADLLVNQTLDKLSKSTGNS